LTGSTQDCIRLLLSPQNHFLFAHGIRNLAEHVVMATQTTSISWNQVAMSSNYVQWDIKKYVQLLCYHLPLPWLLLFLIPYLRQKRVMMEMAEHQLEEVWPPKHLYCQTNINSISFKALLFSDPVWSVETVS
jgi:hypothetical protein